MAPRSDLVQFRPMLGAERREILSHFRKNFGYFFLLLGGEIKPARQFLHKQLLARRRSGLPEPLDPVFIVHVGPQNTGEYT